MYTWMPCKLTYTFSCTRCMMTHEAQAFFLQRYADFPYPHVPEDWHLVEGHLVCPAHMIDVRVDGEVVLSHRPSDATKVPHA